MRLLLPHELALQLDQSPEDNIFRSYEALGGKAAKSLTKSSILKFLDLKYKVAAKSSQKSAKK